MESIVITVDAIASRCVCFRFDDRCENVVQLLLREWLRQPRQIASHTVRQFGVAHRSRTGY
jgi:hypothetical protein